MNDPDHTVLVDLAGATPAPSSGAVSGVVVGDGPDSVAGDGPGSVVGDGPDSVAGAARDGLVAAAAAGVEIRELRELAELDEVYRLYDSIWRPDPKNPPVTTELLRALTKAGNYVGGAYDGDELIGACVGFFGAPAEVTMHSHVAGVSQAARGRNVGFALKLHQRAWALERGVTAISWTFDPLIRRNAYFNLVKLAAHPTEYLTNFYGFMADGINNGDDTDRLLVRWQLDAPDVAKAARRPGSAAPGGQEVAEAARRPGSAAPAGQPDAATAVRHGSAPGARQPGARVASTLRAGAAPTPSALSTSISPSTSAHLTERLREATVLLSAGDDGRPLIGIPGSGAGPVDVGRPLVGVPGASGAGAATVLVAVPGDVERLRGSDPAAAKEWRAALREVLGGLLAEGARVTGFDRAGWYVLELPVNGAL